MPPFLAGAHILQDRLDRDLMMLGEELPLSSVGITWTLCGLGLGPVASNSDGQLAKRKQ